MVFIESKEELMVGSFVKVVIREAMEYDLVGELAASL